MDSMVSLKDAREYLLSLSTQLEELLDEDYRRGLDALLGRFDEYFRIVASVNLRASDDRMIEPDEATEISDYGFVMLLQLVDLMEKLDLPHKRREIEQVSLVLARWTVSYHGTINYLEPLVNAIAQLAELLNDKAELLALSELINSIVDHCAENLKRDTDDNESTRPWRLLHINRSIIATRTQNLDVMKHAFDEFLLYLPDDAPGFFAEGMKEMDALNYPSHVRKVMETYFQKNVTRRLH